MSGPSVHQTNIKTNCFSSIELYKTGHEMSHSCRTKTKQISISFMVEKCSSIYRRLMSTVGNEDRLIVNEANFLFFANARATGTPKTTKCPGRDSSCIKYPGFTRGDARGLN